jgi:dihydroxy-acid dehydratase
MLAGRRGAGGGSPEEAAMIGKQRSFRGPEMSRTRALIKAMGYTDEELTRPRIGVANTWSETSPGHYHLKTLAEAVKAGIWQAGGTPVEFSSFGMCALEASDSGIRYDLPTRDIIAADVEACTELHLFDGLVLISSCDKNVPAHLVAAARLDIPSIILPGGPMRTGTFEGKPAIITDLDLETFKYAVGKGTMPMEQMLEFEENACPGCGACQLLGTANTMQCMAEALGMALPLASSALADSGERLRLAKRTGIRAVELVQKRLKPSQIMRTGGVENAIRVLHAIGGSTNAVVHLLAMIEELELDPRVTLETFERLGKETPFIADVKPGGQYPMEAFHEAGGVPAVMKQIISQLDLTVATVAHASLREQLAECRVRNEEVIHPLSKPLAETGILILRGNLATSSVTRPMVGHGRKTFRGPARVFNSLEEALEGVKAGQLKKGEALILRYEGPRGGPGCTDIFALMGFVGGAGLGAECAVITDGKASGFCEGSYVVQVSPEAYVGGPLALVRNGDIVEIDIPNGRLEVRVSPEEMQRRRAAWIPPAPRIKRGFLTIYHHLALPVERGGGINLRL